MSIEGRFEAKVASRYLLDAHDESDPRVGGLVE
jgi:hypothetical protein